MAPEPRLELEERIVRAVDAVSPSVARVDTLRSQSLRGTDGRNSWGQATALAIERAGLLVTNHRVVDAAARVRVTVPDGRELAARVLGGDAVTDVAVLRVDAVDLPAASLGDSDLLRVGQFVLAVGNALGLPGGPTVSLGVLSALGRPLPGSDFVFEGLIQTDAAINSGNSGGPLVDLTGAVVGLSCSVAAFAQGVGFALPLRAVQRITQEIVRAGHVERPWLGVSVAQGSLWRGGQGASRSPEGVLVEKVVPRSPAHRAGIRPGDLLTRVGPFEIRTVRQMLEAIAKYPIGTEIDLTFRRRGESLATLVPLLRAPDERLAAR